MMAVWGRGSGTSHAGSIATRGVRSCVGLLALLAMVGVAACGQDAQPSTKALGTASFALDLPNAGIIEKAEYDVRISFLETNPPTPTLQETYSSVSFGGELLSIIPCTTGADGDGLNQVDISAKIYVRGRAEPFTASAGAVFTCVRNADTLVNVVLNVIGQLDNGNVDIDVMVAGTLCASKVDMKDDSWLGVCPDAKCGNSDELFVFANTCEAVQADAPTFWICGDPADWKVIGGRADAFFPVPQHNGDWTFGVTALDVFKMGQADPSITAADGTVKVWAGLSASRAHFVRQGGQTTRRENGPVVYEFAAELAVAPRGAGQPAPELLLLVRKDSQVIGSRVTWQRRFGACDEPAEGVTLYPGLKVLDVRRDGNQAVRITFADPDTGFASSTARCETGWNETGASPRPTITCGSPTPLAF